MFEFYKMQACGNDFILIDNIDGKFRYNIQPISKFLCDRNIGIGADGIILLEKSNIYDFRFRIFNKDSSEAKMCGNGIRCAAKFLLKKYSEYLKNDLIKFETKSGLRVVQMIDKDKFKVYMGEYELDFRKIPVYYSVNYYDKSKKSIVINIDDFDYEVFPISVGNEHVVCFVDDLEKIDIDKIGKTIENYKYFPNRTNVEFVKRIDNSKIEIRVWERGVGETLSCGTGSVAAASISNIIKGLENKIEVHTKGGILNIEIEDRKVFLIGEAKFVYKGSLIFDN